MRVLWIDIDTLRPDHLGCYGYHRATSPDLDAIAARGVRFDQCWVSDAPCLPSRAALMTGRFGIHNGVVNHGGVAADPFPDGPGREFQSALDQESLFRCLRRAGLHVVTVSPFAERHSAWWWYANANEAYNTGKNGMESAEEVTPTALDWLARRGTADNWFLHVNIWDPHTPYRAPASVGEPFSGDPLPAWYTEEIRRAHWDGVGPHSAREVRGYGPYPEPKFPRQPGEIASMADARKLFDGYDTGVRWADEHAGRLVHALADLGVLEDTAIVVSSDHGETLGELNIYGDHQCADGITSHVPFLLAFPGLKAGVDAGLHYQSDLAATLVELLGGKVPARWDGRGCAAPLKAGSPTGRDSLVVSQMAWSCQRAARWQDWILIRSFHDGYHAFPEYMLFNLKDDPHEQHDLAAARPEIASHGRAILESWHAEAMKTAGGNPDPLQTVLAEGGPYHCKGELKRYLERLRATGRGKWADQLAAMHPGER
ncbi:MAG: sulfatase [Candidatus Coatesbacteria bacterium]